jgi:hypothetical protein
MASKKSYTLPRGPFTHAPGTSSEVELGWDTVDKNWSKVPKGAQEDYMRAGLVAEVDPEVIRAMSDPATLDENTPPAAEG